MPPPAIVAERDQAHYHTAFPHVALLLVVLPPLFIRPIGPIATRLLLLLPLLLLVLFLVFPRHVSSRGFAVALGNCLRRSLVW